MEQLNNDGLKQEFEELLKSKTQELQRHLTDGQMPEALAVIKSLQEARDQSLYQEVGRLTRALHNAINNFNIEAETVSEKQSMSDMSDARDRLSYVVDMTEKAANKTMDLVEESMPVADKLGKDAKRLREYWRKLIDREMSGDQFRDLYWEMDAFLERSANESENLYGNLSSILLAQDFQDLTGQVIHRVTNLVKEVEASLVDLIFMASQVETITGIVHLPEESEKQEADQFKGHGPQISKDAADDVVTSQDDVDDLLSSLGF
ncbi:protein phosphatase CheZ [Gynuella sunshinyii]|uniref:Protein phosphatase CheZ n=1 Tax=Gynuella sunshinyii YC6258 TaxID=1445510 RepID=A0A0C5VP39_9GAMM|nr:protein phosphatase CheZ [Gynuella sunshinyii]AJQ95158.1 chemotaxis protein [Gynuella sunshinyii YC6258]